MGTYSGNAETDKPSPKADMRHISIPTPPLGGLTRKHLPASRDVLPRPFLSLRIGLRGAALQG